MKKCPYCAEEIQEDAKICRWCHSELTPAALQPARPNTSGKAIASLVLGLASPEPILAIVFGHLARRDIRRSGGHLTGAGMALAGLILGYCKPAVLIIAAIAIPNLLKSKMAANQASAVESLRAINTCEVTYSATYNTGYTRDLVSLGPPSSGDSNATAAGLIDSVLASGARDGYGFVYTPGPTDRHGVIKAYTIRADPITPGNTGLNHYFTDETNVIRQETDRRADKNSPPIGGL